MGKKKKNHKFIYLLLSNSRVVMWGGRARNGAVGRKHPLPGLTLSLTVSSNFGDRRWPTHIVRQRNNNSDRLYVLLRCVRGAFGTKDAHLLPLASIQPPPRPRPIATIYHAARARRTSNRRPEDVKIRTEGAKIKTY